MTSLAPGTVVAFFVLSAIGWSVTVPFSRLTGAVGWLLVMTVGGIVWPGPAVRLIVAAAE